MWPFQQKNNELVTISLTPKNISFCLFEKRKKNKTKQKIKLYKRFPLKNLEYAQSIIFNPTSIKNCIKKFFKKNNLTSNPVALSLSGPKIFEKIINLQNASPKPYEFKLSELKYLNWNSLYLCPSERGGFDFFICGIKPEHLFSYQLLGLTCNINLQTIITENLTQLYLYKALQGKFFRQSQLSIDLLTQRYNVKKICSTNLLEQSIEIKPENEIVFQKEQTFLKTHLGLFLSKEI